MSLEHKNTCRFGALAERTDAVVLLDVEVPADTSTSIWTETHCLDWLNETKTEVKVMVFSFKGL